MVAILLAGFAALAFGLNDFLGGVAARRSSARGVVTLTFPISAILLVAAATQVPASARAEDLVLGLGWGVLASVGIVTFYYAMAIGPMSLVSPLTALVIAGVPIAAGLAFGELLSTVSGFGVGLSLLAVLLICLPNRVAVPESKLSARAVRPAIIAGVAFGLAFVLAHQIDSTSGLWPVALARGTAGVVFVVVRGCWRARRARQGVTPWGF